MSDLIGAALSLLDVLYTAYCEDKENVALLCSLRSRISRIKTNVNLCRELPCLQTVFVSVEERVTADFVILVSELEQVEAKRERRKLRRLLTAGSTGEHIRNIQDRLGELERHLEIFGMMKNLHGSFETQVSDIGLELRRISVQMPAMNEELGKFLQYIENVLAVFLTRFERFTGTPVNSGLRKLGCAEELLSRPEESLDRHEKQSIDLIQSFPGQLRNLSLEVSRSTLPPADKANILKKFDDLRLPWNLDLDDIVFDVGRRGRPITLGEGSFASVYKAKLQLRGTDGAPEGRPVRVAAKELKLSEKELAAFQPDVLRELFLLRECAHPCILHTYGAFWPESDSVDEDYSPPIIVTELMTHNLENAVASPAFEDIEVRRAVLVDVAKALAYLHEKNIVHRDVKPENVLLRIVEDELVRPAKLGDFGVSRKLHQATLQRTYARTRRPSGTVIYMPPEVLQDTSRCVSRRSWDVWSFGLLVCMVAGRKDFPFNVTAFNAIEVARDGRLVQAAQQWADSIPDVCIRRTAKRCLKCEQSERVPMNAVPSMLSSIDAEQVLEEGTTMFFHYWESGQKEDGVRAAELFRLAWDKGAVKAARWLCYCQQLEIHESWVSSVGTCARGSEKGDLICKSRLGQYYLYKARSDDEKEKAVALVREASAAGDVAASFRLAGCYHYGFGVPKDDEKGRKIKEIALKSADEALESVNRKPLDALERADLLYWKGWAEDNEERRAQLYLAAFRQGHFDARGALFLEGFSTGAADIGPPLKFGVAGSLFGALWLGLHLLRQSGSERGAGFQVLAKAAGHGFGLAQHYVAKCYQHGVAVPRSASRAREYFQAAEGKFAVGRPLDQWWDETMSTEK